MKKANLLGLIGMIFAVSLTAQDKIASVLLEEMELATIENRTVKALILLEDRLDVKALDDQLYAGDVPLAERAYTVITALQAKAAETQMPLLQFLIEQPGSEIAGYQPFWIANMIAVDCVPAMIYELAGRGDVRYMQIDGLLERDEPFDAKPAPLSIPNGHEPGLSMINAHLMWQAGYTGEGTIVMNLDTGVNGNHPALSYKWRGNHVPWDQAWIDPAFNSEFPNDGDGSSSHGTHTMGTMCGLDTTTHDTIGVAFGAEWIASNSLIGGGSHTSRSVESFQWAMDPDNNPATIDDMPAAIGNSWFDPSIGTQCNPATNPYIDVINALEAAGIAVVFSAGNSGPGPTTVTSPKNVNTDEVNFWATGAVDIAGNIASFSSRGPVVAECITGDESLDIKPEASAHGVSVRSSQFSNGYGFLSGTSMACPHVVGAIALLRSAVPGATGHELKMALYETAVDAGPPGEDNDYGMGIIDVWAAFQTLGAPESPSGFSIYSDYTTPDQMSMSWTDPTRLVNGDTLTNDAFTVLIERDGSLIDSLPGGTGNYIDMGLEDGQTYAYTIYARIDSSDFSSAFVSASWIAGGSRIPNPPTGFTLSGDTASIAIGWTSPSENVDGTPMDDYAGINLYRNGLLETSFTRTSIDTAIADSQVYELPEPGFFEWYIRVVDNEDPPNESDSTNVFGTPLSAPFAESFNIEGEPNPAVWINSNTDINDGAVDAPSGPYSLNLNGKPDGEDIIDLKPVDLSGWNLPLFARYYYQPAGTGDKPEPGDSLRVYFRNDLGQWILVRSYPGSELAPFTEEVIDVLTAPNGGGSFLHSLFQVRFRSTGGAGSFANDNWFVDNFELNTVITGIEDQGQLPSSFMVSRNYPNPFNPSTTIRYELPQQSKVKLTVYNMLGQKILKLVDGLRPAGRYEVLWNGTNERNEAVASGIYIYRFEAADNRGASSFRSVQKMILMK